jgi:hypothetical protein
MYVPRIHTHKHSDTTECISHMHSAYVICTDLYHTVSECICIRLYVSSADRRLGTVCSAYVPVCLEYSSHIHADTCIPEGSAYLYVNDCILSLNTGIYAFFKECISVCIWLYLTAYLYVSDCISACIRLYFTVTYTLTSFIIMIIIKAGWLRRRWALLTYMHICINFVVFNTFYCALSAASRHSRISRGVCWTPPVDGQASVRNEQSVSLNRSYRTDPDLSWRRARCANSP